MPTFNVGEAYADSGRYFTYPDGRALRPEYISGRFTILVARYAPIRYRHCQENRAIEWIAWRHRVPAEAIRIVLAAPLPPLNFHGVRHGAAILLLTAKVPTKVNCLDAKSRRRQGVPNRYSVRDRSEARAVSLTPSCAAS